MDIKEALTITIELARDNIVTDDEMERQQTHQLAACEMVDAAMNNFLSSVIVSTEDAAQAIAAMRRAEEFIRGFEDDDLQEGIPELLAGLRAAISKATGAPFEIEKPKAKEPTCFDYFEVRPCIEIDGNVESFSVESDFHDKAADLDVDHRVFWTIYGMEGGIATAIGDFATKAAAHNVMDAMIAPMANARNLIRDGDGKLPFGPRTEGERLANAAKAADDIDDFINQCSNADRI